MINLCNLLHEVKFSTAQRCFLRSHTFLGYLIICFNFTVNFQKNILFFNLRQHYYDRCSSQLWDYSLCKSKFSINTQVYFIHRCKFQPQQNQSTFNSQWIKLISQNRILCQTVHIHSLFTIWDLKHWILECISFCHFTCLLDHLFFLVPFI